MSVIVAVKENDVIYMGADTLSIMGDKKYNEFYNLDKLKITKLSNGVLLGHAGSVSSIQKLVLNEEWFADVEKEGLDKKYLITKVIPRLRQELARFELLEEDGTMKASFLVAYKDKLYSITSNFVVYKLNEYTATGAGKYFAIAHLSKDNATVQERIMKALRASSKMCQSVGGPFVLIDTRNLQFEIKE